MNEANKNEVDLLLRSFAQGRNESAPGGSDHLDADELNAYAEGLVPPAARLRYIGHLADCSSCRGIVVGLTQAAGAVTHREPVTQANKVGFWQSVSTFFSSPALRYAVPALVLTIVIGIGLLVFKQQRDSQFVAMNRPENSALPVNGAQPAAPVEPSPAQVAPPAAAQPTVGVTEADRSKTQDKKTVTEVPPATDATVAKAAKGRDVAAGDSGAGVVGQSQPAPAPAPAKAAEAGAPAEVQKLGEFAREPLTKQEVAERAAREEYKTKDDEDIHGPNRARNAPMSTAQRAGDLMSRGGPSANKNNTNEGETRTVMGKRFTRGSAGWVDTEYESQGLTRLTRGSDRYRALIADEPGIGTIAERLDGVVIVVWKGRAYRIQ